MLVSNTPYIPTFILTLKSWTIANEQVSKLERDWRGDTRDSPLTCDTREQYGVYPR